MQVWALDSSFWPAALKLSFFKRDSSTEKWPKLSDSLREGGSAVRTDGKEVLKGIRLELIN